jgi:hypothetical protein
MAWFSRNDGCYVYWLCDDTSVLYVGFTESVARRVSEHRKNKSWFSDVQFIDIRRFATKEEALREEALSILFGESLHNIDMNVRRARNAFNDARSGVNYQAVEEYFGVPIGRF